MIKIFGDYQNIEMEKNTEYLKLCFSPSSLSLKQRWRNNGLSADFLGDYFTSFFPNSPYETNGYNKQDDIKSTVSYIANELLENAMKFSNENIDFPISLRLNLNLDNLTFWLINNVNNKTAQDYEKFIAELLNNDPQELYFYYLEKSAEMQVCDFSGLGIMTMINDYGAKMGWKFETTDNLTDNIQVTTMVKLAI